MDRTERTASDVLAEMARVYETCQTYRDKGQATSVYADDGRERHDEMVFRTAFVRPDRFRFELRFRFDESARWRCCIVWVSGEEVQTVDHNGPLAQLIQDALAKDATVPNSHKTDSFRMSLNMAIGAATGVSGGSAHIVPAMLLPELIGGARMTDLQNPRLLVSEMYERSYCYVVEGQTPNGSIKTLWIDQTSYLLRKVETRRASAPDGTPSVVVYEPQINVAIPESELVCGTTSD
ncbi:MAG: outer membrane lipoprotein-sorting protein [Candidatus Hydrogenedentes bacterium]|nr:outer membrane lipoprotein-sorting protein [Candidatus Hydrogenedentota bacterium]